MAILILLGMIIAALWFIPRWLESAVQKFYHSNRYSPPEYDEMLISHSVACPYCKNPISIEEIVVRCMECKTPHHFDCWNEVGSCSVFGCGGKTERLI